MMHIKCPACEEIDTCEIGDVEVGKDVMCTCKNCGATFPLLKRMTLTDESVCQAASDPVNAPSHYIGKIECIDYLRDKLTKEEFTGFCMGNVLKYSSRWRKKDGLQDLKKAKVYLDWAIQNEEKE